MTLHREKWTAISFDLIAHGDRAMPCTVCAGSR